MTGMCRYISETVQTRSSALWRAGACRKRAPGDHEFTCVRCPRSGLRATTLAASPAGDIDLVDAEHRSGNPDRPGLARPSDPWSIEEPHEPLGLVPSAPAEQARPAAPRPPRRSSPLADGHRAHDADQLELLVRGCRRPRFPTPGAPCFGSVWTPASRSVDPRRASLRIEQADKCARLYRPAKHGSTAHRARDLRNSCSTAELCRRLGSVGDASRRQLFHSPLPLDRWRRTPARH